MSILKSELMRTYDASKVTAEGIMDIAEIVDRTVKRALRERPKGKWIEDAETFYKAVNEYGGVDENTPYFTDDIACPECLTKFSVIDNETERFDFCPHCGADMRGGDDDNGIIN